MPIKKRKDEHIYAFPGCPDDLVPPRRKRERERGRENKMSEGDKGQVGQQNGIYHFYTLCQPKQGELAKDFVN